MNEQTAQMPTLLTVKQACGFLNVGRTKLYELIRAKRVPVVRLGSRSTRIPRAGLDRLAASWEGGEE
jgi:excisionase family DNA binding protein